MLGVLDLVLYLRLQSHSFRSTAGIMPLAQSNHLIMRFLVLDVGKLGCWGGHFDQVGATRFLFCHFQQSSRVYSISRKKLVVRVMW